MTHLDDCACSCCDNRADQLAHGRDYPLRDWCSCANYETEEQCDCPPCLVAVR